jgi:oligogalacturonide lyase
MKSKIWIYIVIVILSADFYINAQSNGIGKQSPAEKKTWIDDSTKCEITQWTNTGQNWHLYFNIESFIDNEDVIIFSTRSGKTNLYKMSLYDGKITQMTDENDLKQSIWHNPSKKILWYFNGDTLKALNTTTFKCSVLFVFDKTKPESFAVTCDCKWLVYSVNKNPGFRANHSTGPFALFKMNLFTKEVFQISPDYGFRMSHVQTNPVDPNQITFCWQHQYREGGEGIVGNTPIRIWWNNLNGESGGPVVPQELGLHRTHEFWFPDGKFIGFSARFLYGPKKGKQFIGYTGIDGKIVKMFPANVGAAHSQMYSDEKHWVSDLYNGSNLVLFTLSENKITETKVLFRHDSTWGEQPTHPHPHFSPDGKFILFSTDKTGTPQVYTVKINL